MFGLPNFALIVAAILAIGNIAAGGYAYTQHERALLAESRNDTLTSQLAAVKAANVSNQNTIAAYRRVNGENAARAMDANKSATAIAARVTDLSNQLAKSEKASGQLREKLRASDAKIAAWGNVPVPATYVDVLRDRWRSVAGYPDADGNGVPGSLRPVSGNSDGP